MLRKEIVRLRSLINTAAYEVRSAVRASAAATGFCRRWKVAER